MRTVGSLLKDERLKQGLTLELVSVETKLPLRSLCAIEADDLTAFGSAFFYKSFVRQYASRIRIDYGEIASLVEARASEMPPPPLPGERDGKLPDVPAINPPRHSDSRWVFPTAALVAVLVGCSGIYAWWEGQHVLNGVSTQTPSSMPNLPPESVPAAVTPTADAPTTPATTSSLGTSRATPLATAQESEAPATRAVISQVSGSDVQLKLSALERVWVSVVADGKSSFSGILQASEIKIFESRETATIRVGNAGGLQVVYNGRSIGALGPRGQPRTAVFTPQNYEILNHQAAELAAPLVELTKYPVGE